MARKPDRPEPDRGRGGQRGATRAARAGSRAGLPAGRARPGRDRGSLPRPGAPIVRHAGRAALGAPAGPRRGVVPDGGRAVSAAGARRSPAAGAAPGLDPGRPTGPVPSSRPARPPALEHGSSGLRRRPLTRAPCRTSGTRTAPGRLVGSSQAAGLGWPAARRGPARDTPARPPSRYRLPGTPAGPPRDGATAPLTRGYGPTPVFRPAPAPAEPPGSPLAADLVRPGEEIVAGRRPVEEALTARRAAHRLLVVPHRRASLEALVLRATHAHVAVVEVEGGTLTSLAGFDGHQGVALIVDARRWASLDDVLARAAARGEPAFVLVLDSLEDPQNLGALLRSAEACGIHGVIFPTRHAAPLTPSAVKTSAGAVEHLLLVPVDDLPAALADLRTHGLRIVGADEAAPLSYRDADLRGPLALVVGSEGRGIGAAVHRRLDLEVRIPMRGRIGSLNAAVAGSVLLFEALTQRDSDVPDQAATSRQDRARAVETGPPGAELAASSGGLPAEEANPPEGAGPADAAGPAGTADAAGPVDTAARPALPGRRHPGTSPRTSSSPSRLRAAASRAPRAAPRGPRDRRLPHKRRTACGRASAPVALRTACGLPVGYPCASRRRSSIGRAAVL